jgi:hypothetical protein
MPGEVVGALFGDIGRSEERATVTLRGLKPIDIVDLGSRIVPNRVQWEMLREGSSDGSTGELVGWFYTDPGIGLFPPRLDVSRTHGDLHLPFELFLIANPVNNEGAFFVWDGDVLVPVDGFSEASVEGESFPPVRWSGSLPGVHEWLGVPFRHEEDLVVEPEPEEIETFEVGNEGTEFGGYNVEGASLEEPGAESFEEAERGSELARVSQPEPEPFKEAASSYEAGSGIVDFVDVEADESKTEELRVGAVVEERLEFEDAWESEAAGGEARPVIDEPVDDWTDFLGVVGTEAGVVQGDVVEWQDDKSEALEPEHHEVEESWNRDGEGSEGEVNVEGLAEVGDDFAEVVEVEPEVEEAPDFGNLAEIALEAGGVEAIRNEGAGLELALPYTLPHRPRSRKRRRRKLRSRYVHRRPRISGAPIDIRVTALMPVEFPSEYVRPGSSSPITRPLTREVAELQMRLLELLAPEAPKLVKPPPRFSPSYRVGTRALFTSILLGMLVLSLLIITPLVSRNGNSPSSTATPTALACPNR